MILGLAVPDEWPLVALVDEFPGLPLSVPLEDMVPLRDDNDVGMPLLTLPVADGDRDDELGLELEFDTVVEGSMPTQYA